MFSELVPPQFCKETSLLYPGNISVVVMFPETLTGFSNTSIEKCGPGTASGEYTTDEN